MSRHHGHEDITIQPIENPPKEFTRESMRQLILDSCPECRAAYELHGIDPADAIVMMPPRPRGRPRWRDLKRRVR